MLLQYNELPEWYQENPHIVNGYRPPNTLNNFTDIIHTLFSLHNETFNIWSHIIGVFYFISIFISIYFEEIALHYKLVLMGYSLCMVNGLICSVMYHTFMCQSHEIYKQCMVCDYQGIVINIFAGGSIFIFCAFQPHTIIIPSLYILIMFCILLLISKLIRNNEWDLPKNKLNRTIIFIMNGLSIVVPAIHALYINTITRYVVDSILVVILIKLIGALFYGFRYPEIKYSNRIMDYIGNSHNFMHIFLLSSSTLHFYNMKHSMNL